MTHMVLSRFLLTDDGRKLAAKLLNVNLNQNAPNSGDAVNVDEESSKKLKTDRKSVV